MSQLGHSRGGTKKEALLYDVKELLSILLRKGVGFGVSGGNTPPDPDKGKEGDVYFDSSTNTVYHRESDVWIDKGYYSSTLFDVRNGLQVIDGYGELGGSLVRDTTVDATGFLFNLINNNALQFNLNPTTVHTEGQVYWNNVAKTLNIDTEVEGTSIQVGQELVVRARNNTGQVIPNGSVVYVDGVQGNRPTIQLATAVSSIAPRGLLGVTTADFGINQTNYVTDFGLVRDLDTSAFTEGDFLYLSTVAGEITNVPPVSPNHRIRIGVCLRSNVNEGYILVNIFEGEHLEDLHDVNIPNTQLNERLAYDGANVWINNQLGTIDTLADKSYTIPSNSQLLIDEGLTIEGNIEIEGRLFIE